MTHADLHMGNVIVDGKIEAILDWEYAGFYPSWVELYRIGNSQQMEDGCLGFNSGETTEQILSVVSELQQFHFACRVKHSNDDMGWVKPPFLEWHRDKKPEHVVLVDQEGWSVSEKSSHSRQS
jgi:thiamine kinase-like enzyme